MKYQKIAFTFLIVILALNSCKKDKGTDIDIVEYNKIIINLDKGIYKPEESAHLTIINNSKKDLILLYCRHGGMSIDNG